MVLHDAYYTDFQVDYHDGLRYSRLERLTGKADLLPAVKPYDRRKQSTLGSPLMQHAQVH